MRKVKKYDKLIPRKQLIGDPTNYAVHTNEDVDELYNLIMSDGSMNQRLGVEYIPNLGIYKVFMGNKRLQVIDKLGTDPVTCTVYEDLTEKEKLSMMVNDNVGHNNNWVNNCVGIALKYFKLDQSLEVLIQTHTNKKSQLVLMIMVGQIPSDILTMVRMTGKDARYRKTVAGKDIPQWSFEEFAPIVKQILGNKPDIYLTKEPLTLRLNALRRLVERVYKGILAMSQPDLLAEIAELKEEIETSERAFEVENQVQQRLQTSVVEHEKKLLLATGELDQKDQKIVQLSTQMETNIREIELLKIRKNQEIRNAIADAEEKHKQEVASLRKNFDATQNQLQQKLVLASTEKDDLSKKYNQFLHDQQKTITERSEHLVAQRLEVLKDQLKAENIEDLNRQNAQEVANAKKSAREQAESEFELEKSNLETELKKRTQQIEALKNENSILSEKELIMNRDIDKLRGELKQITQKLEDVQKANLQKIESKEKELESNKQELRALQTQLAKTANELDGMAQEKALTLAEKLAEEKINAVEAQARKNIEQMQREFQKKLEEKTVQTGLTIDRVIKTLNQRSTESVQCGDQLTSDLFKHLNEEQRKEVLRILRNTVHAHKTHIATIEGDTIIDVSPTQRPQQVINSPVVIRKHR